MARWGWPDLDWSICYQSRVGPLKWIGPATDAEIRRAGAEGKALIVAPIAFVSEHSETLVELDMDMGSWRTKAACATICGADGRDARRIHRALADLVDAGGAQRGARDLRRRRICPMTVMGVRLFSGDV